MNEKLYLHFDDLRKAAAYDPEAKMLLDQIMGEDNDYLQFQVLQNRVTVVSYKEAFPYCGPFLTLSPDDPVADVYKLLSCAKEVVAQHSTATLMEMLKQRPNSFLQF